MLASTTPYQDVAEDGGEDAATDPDYDALYKEGDHTVSLLDFQRAVRARHREGSMGIENDEREAISKFIDFQ